MITWDDDKLLVVLFPLLTNKPHFDVQENLMPKARLGGEKQKNDVIPHMCHCSIIFTSAPWWHLDNKCDKIKLNKNTVGIYYIYTTFIMATDLNILLCAS